MFSLVGPNAVNHARGPLLPHNSLPPTHSRRITMKALQSIVLAASCLTLGAPALAQFAKPEDAIKYRKSSFFVMQQNFARLGAMAAGRMPFDAKVAADSAAAAEFVARLPWAAFGEGTDKGDTRAKPEIWKSRPSSRNWPTRCRLRCPSLLLLPKLATWTASRPVQAQWVAAARHATMRIARTELRPSPEFARSGRPTRKSPARPASGAQRVHAGSPESWWA